MNNLTPHLNATMQRLAQDKIIEYPECFYVNDRYAIYKDNGTIYDLSGKRSDDIPQKYFTLRDKLVPRD